MSRFLSALPILALAATAACTGGVPALTDDAASSLLHAHTEALTTADTLRIKPFWSRRSSAREGFWYMHSWSGNRLLLSDWPQFLEMFDLRVLGSDWYDTYATVDIEWVPVDASGAGEPAPPRPMRYYLVREADRWVLANPIDALTDGWSSRETDCFRFHYPEELARDGHVDAMERMDVECGRVLEAIGLDPGTKIDFFVARSAAECGQLLDQPPAHGYAATSFPFGAEGPIGFRLATSTSFFHPHEAVHVLQALARIPDVHPALTEGFAVAFGGGPVFSPDLALATTRQTMRTPDFIPLRQLLGMSDDVFFRWNFITYVEAGAFVRFLIDQFGLDSFRQLTFVAGPGTGVATALEQVFGMTVEQMEVAWMEWLAALPLPEVGFSIPADAVEIFSMADPANDDVGDGDYAYPNERFAPGVFDLTGFEVFKDSAHAYFTVTFRKLQEPVRYSPGGERFVPGVTIAINMGPLGERHLRHLDHGVRFPAGSGYDVKLSTGTQVSVSDRHGIMHFTSGPVWTEMANTVAGTITFSLPIAYLGEPDEDWKYFVGIGLATDRAMNFLHGGPAPVYPNHPVFLTGGNNADGHNPAFIDVLLPETVNQVDVLGRYDDRTAAIVPSVGSQ